MQVTLCIRLAFRVKRVPVCIESLHQIDILSKRGKIKTEIESLVRRGVCAGHRPLPRNVERHQGVGQVKSIEGFTQSG
jgi:hypothetical protein